jgi:hypothetical protein
MHPASQLIWMPIQNYSLPRTPGGRLNEATWNFTSQEDEVENVRAILMEDVTDAARVPRFDLFPQPPRSGVSFSHPDSIDLSEVVDENNQAALGKLSQLGSVIPGDAFMGRCDINEEQFLFSPMHQKWSSIDYACLFNTMKHHEIGPAHHWFGKKHEEVDFSDSNDAETFQAYPPEILNAVRAHRDQFDAAAANGHLLTDEKLKHIVRSIPNNHSQVGQRQEMWEFLKYRKPRFDAIVQNWEDRILNAE